MKVALAERQVTSINVNRRIWKAFKRYALREGRSMSDLLDDAVRRYVEPKPKQEEMRE